VEEEENTADLKRMVNIINRIGVNGVIDAVRGLVPEEKAQVTVSTAHKAKGLEWSSVKVADDFCPPDPDEDEAADPADFLLAYVTVTRAKELLDPGSLGEPWLWKQ
jgi:superfamily I DNA/RNA helicase